MFNLPIEGEELFVLEFGDIVITLVSIRRLCSFLLWHLFSWPLLHGQSARLILCLGPMLCILKR
jgi:hypothetical protein